MIALRDYQKNALSAQWHYWKNTGNAPLIIAPTGAGKSILIAKTIQDILNVADDARICVVTHVQELIQQNLDELLTLAPDLWNKIGVMSAGLNRKDAHAQITFGGIQTMFKNDIGRQSLIIIDEAHLIPRKTTSMYGQFLEQQRQHNSNVRIQGLTATPYRMDSGKLHEGSDALFDGIAYEISLLDLIKDNYLVEPVTQAPDEMTDLTIRAGEYSTESQEFSLESHIEDYAKTIADATRNDRCLCFLPSVKTAEDFAYLLTQHQLSAAFVTGAMPLDARAEIIEMFKSGKITHLCNVNIMTTGSNIPEISAIALLRATRSPALYVQMVGRGLRLAESKTQCKVYDFGGNAVRHGPLNKPFTFHRERSRKMKPVGKTCPECDTVLPVNQRTCDNCDWIEPKIEQDRDPKLKNKAFTGDIVGYAEQPEWKKCFRWEAQQWIAKTSGAKMICVTYDVQNHTYPIREWLGPEHDYRKLLGSKWRIRYRTMTGDIEDIPETVEDAVLWVNETANPESIRVARKDDSKYYDIVDISPSVEYAPVKIDEIAEIHDDF